MYIRIYFLLQTMLRLIANNLIDKLPKLSAHTIFHQRCMSNKTQLIIGGGLEKLQGGLKEEKYFFKLNNDLMANIRKQGARFKSENYIICNQSEEVLKHRDNRTALRGTCAINKHKNCLEEAFFLNEQSECFMKLSKDYKLIKDEMSEGLLKNYYKN